MFKKLYRLNWLFLVIYAATTHAAPGSNNAGGLPQCNTDLGICQTTNTQLQSSLTTCQATNSQLQTSLSSCQSTVTQLQDQFQQAQIVYANLQTAYGNCLTTNTQLQQQSQTNQAQITSLQTALNSCQATNAQLQQQLQAAQAQIAALQTGSGGSTPPPSTANMPGGLAEYVEFSLLPSSVSSDRYQSNKWDLTGTYTNISASTGMSWDATLKAWKAPGGSDVRYAYCSDAIDTGWHPGPGAKTACMWKRYYNGPIAGGAGTDGYQDYSGSGGTYFFYGTGGYPFGPNPMCSYPSYSWWGASGSSSQWGACNDGPKQDDWAFYCIASGGDSGTSSFYAAVPGDTAPIKRTPDINNRGDSGNSNSPVGMRYGCMSTGQGGSQAYYGSMIHFNSKLTADQVNQVYQATKVFYPGHGGTR